MTNTIETISGELAIIVRQTVNLYVLDPYAKHLVKLHLTNVSENHYATADKNGKSCLQDLLRAGYETAEYIQKNCKMK